MESIEYLLQELSSPDWQERSHSVAKYIAESDPAFNDFLIAHIHDRNTNLRNAVKTLLIHRRNSAILFDSLKNHDEHVRIAAVNALGQIADPISIPPLMELYHSETAINVRLSLYEAFQHLKSYDIQVELIQKFSDMNPMEKQSAIYVFRDTGLVSSELLALLHRHIFRSELRIPILEALERLGNKDSLKYVAHHLNPEFSLQFLASARAIVAIVQRYTASREVAIQSLSELKAVQKDHICRTLVDFVAKNKKDFSTAIGLLSMLDGNLIFPYLFELIPYARQEVINALLPIAQVHAERLLPYAINHEAEARAVCGFAILAAAPLESARELIRLLPLEHDREAMRMKVLALYQRQSDVLNMEFLSVAMNLLQISEFKPLWHDFEAILLKIEESNLQSWLKNLLVSYSELSVFALELLTKKNITIPFDWIQSYLTDSKTELRRLAVLCLSKIRPSCSPDLLNKIAIDSNDEIRKALSQVLKEDRESGSLVVLEKLMVDTVHTVRIEAILSLAERGVDRFAEDWLRQIQIPPDEYSHKLIRALLKIKNPSICSSLELIAQQIETTDPMAAETIRESLS